MAILLVHALRERPLGALPPPAAVALAGCAAGLLAGYVVIARALARARSTR